VSGDGRDARILTTHTGSLPRPPELVRMVVERYGRQDIDPEALEERIAADTAAVVKRQLDIGIDIPSDGEFSKVSFSQYVHERFAGFSEIGSARLLIDDLEDFPGVAERAIRSADADSWHATAMFSCIGPIEVSDPDAIKADIDRFKAALGDRPTSQAFLGTATPGQIAFNFPNDFYGSHEEYLAALAEAMRYEYRAVTDAGFNLQLDSPDLAMSAHVRTEGSDIIDHASHRAAAIEALNHAIEGIAPEQLRLHICWGNYGGPHHRDVPLEAIFEPILKANVGTFSFEAANPRHAHEWELFTQLQLPEGKSIMPGVIDVTTNRIEHPRLVAQRLVRFAELVGRENVLAGTDCGFSTVAGWEHVDPEVCWAKLESLVAGARLASEQLW
jgi:5-methyltetrahydropteroyltriglutamate--homocysteine methyltransferase